MSTTARQSEPVTLQESDLPQVLRGAREDLAHALTTPLLAAWPEDESFTDAPQPQAIGEVLVAELHTHLVNARIGYLFRETIEAGGEVKAGMASKVGGKLHYFSDLDFLVEINWTAWRELTPAQRIALIDHELCHFGISETQSGEPRRVILPHDVEEFGAIVRRWGLWQPNLRAFQDAVNAQMGLFEEPARPENVDSSLKEQANAHADQVEREGDAPQLSVEAGGKDRRGKRKGSK